MLLLRKIAIYFFSLITLFCFYLILVQAEKIFYWSAVLTVILFLVHLFIVGSQKAKKTSLAFFGLGIFFVSASISFLILLENYNLKMLLIFLTSLAIFFYWLLLLNFFHWPSEYQPFSLADFSHYLLLISWFFLNTAVFALTVFLNLSFWLAALFLVFFFFLIQIWEFWLHKKIIRSEWRFFLAGEVIIFQLVIILSLLPLSYFVKGFLMVLWAYLWFELALAATRETWSRKNFFKKIILSLIMIIIILTTSRWF